MNIQEYWKKHWPLILAGLFVLAIVYALLKRGSTTTASTGGTSDAAQAQLAATEAQVEGHVAEAFIAGDVAKSQAYYQGAAQYYQSYYNYQSTKTISDAQVQIQKSADTAAIEKAHTAAGAQQSHDIFSIAGGVLGALLPFGL